MSALMLAPATPALAAKAQLEGPASARMGSRVSFTAKGLVPGTYTMRLVYTAIPDHDGVAGTDCLARVGAATAARSGTVTIAGALPKRLACRSAAGPVEGYETTKPGAGYRITVSRNQKGKPYGTTPFLEQHLRLTS